MAAMIPPGLHLRRVGVDGFSYTAFVATDKQRKTLNNFN